MEKFISKKVIFQLQNTAKILLEDLLCKSVITYSDPECTVVQCDVKAAYRSISELHAIVTTRFKFTSLQASLVKIIKDVI
jgi:hypothetical protein